jgi:hypothetical protein
LERRFGRSTMCRHETTLFSFIRVTKLILAGLFLADVALAADKSWQPIFNGKDL